MIWMISITTLAVFIIFYHYFPAFSPFFSMIPTSISPWNSPGQKSAAGRALGAAAAGGWHENFTQFLNMMSLWNIWDIWNIWELWDPWLSNISLYDFDLRIRPYELIEIGCIGMLVEIMDLDCLQMYHKCIQKLKFYRHESFLLSGYLVVDSKIPFQWKFL